MTFTSSGFTNSSTAETYHLFKRESNAISTWSDLGGAASVSTGNSTMTFENITSFPQFIISKNNAILPIELLSFSANLENKKVKLDWITANEIDNKGFNIQRSNNGSTWQNIGWEEGKGDTNQGHIYTFMDTDVKVGHQYYYRLEQEDFDGKIDYSNIEIVYIPTQNIISIAPNPAKDFIEISFGKKAQGKYQILLFDNLGRELQRMTLNANDLKNQKIDIANYPKSIYFLSILKNGQQLEQFKFLKK